MNQKLNVLIACEESQAVCKEFRRLGHNAYSCDLQKCSGGAPQWHINCSVIPLLTNSSHIFKTQDEQTHIVSKWDLIIAHPPCTHLSTSGARHFEKKRQDGRQLDAIKFFKLFLDCDCEHVAIENPVNIIGGDYIKEYFPEYGDLPKSTQRIQPYEYGDKSRKTTCLWIKGLPNLIPTNIVEPELITYTCANGKKVTFSKDYVHNTGKEVGKKRSKTYPGIAQAMAEQWSNYLTRG